MAELGNRNKRRRHERKAKLLKMFGGKCNQCGYDRSPSALEFHHRDSASKEFTISGNRLTSKPWEVLVAEAEKCELLCCNCHRERHDVEGWVHEDGRRTPR